MDIKTKLDVFMLLLQELFIIELVCMLQELLELFKTSWVKVRDEHVD